MSENTKMKLIHLLQRNRVMDLKSLQKNLNGRSRASLFRDLMNVDYFSSYSHMGKFYTLKITPTFDSYGLWHFKDIGFSKHGNLRDTITHFINCSKHGMKHLDLKDRLKIPVHGTLLNLVNSGEIARVNLDGNYLYVSNKLSISKLQIDATRKRQKLEINLPSENIPTWMAIEVLTEVIKESSVEAAPLKIAFRLSSRGKKISFNQVKKVLEFYEIKKKLHMK